MNIELRRAKHRAHYAANPERYAWAGAKRRCHDPDSPKYTDYGGRGIIVWAPWYLDFDLFLSYIGKKPFPGAELDRIDNDRGYVPGNVRWVTRKVNGDNRRTIRMLEHGGARKTLTEWATDIGITRQGLARRLTKMTLAEALHIKR